MTLALDKAAAVLTIAGDLQIDSIEQLRAPLWQCVSNQPEVILDLSGVDACDTAAFQVLLACKKTAAAMGKPFCIVAASPAFNDSAATLGLDLASTWADTDTASPKGESLC